MARFLSCVLRHGFTLQRRLTLPCHTVVAYRRSVTPSLFIRPWERTPANRHAARLTTCGQLARVALRSSPPFYLPRRLEDVERALAGSAQVARRALRRRTRTRSSAGCSSTGCSGADRQRRQRGQRGLFGRRRQFRQHRQRRRRRRRWRIRSRRRRTHCGRASRCRDRGARRLPACRHAGRRAAP